MKEEFATLATYYHKTRVQFRHFIIEIEMNVKNKKVDLVSHDT